MLVASDTAERLVLAPLIQRAARAGALTQSGGRLLDRLSESHVASAILEGTSIDVPPLSLEAETVSAPVGLVRGAQDEATRIGQLRTWMQDAGRGLSQGRGIPVAAIGSRRGGLRPGVVRAYTLTLLAESGAAIHTEVVVVHEEQKVGRLKTPADVRLAIRALGLLDDAPEGPLRLFEERIQEVSASCVRAGASLVGREKVVSGPIVSSAQQLVQRGLFDRRLESASDSRARSRDAAIEEARHRARALDGWSRTTVRLKLYAVLLVAESAR
jgi:hypothetical protein